MRNFKSILAGIILGLAVFSFAAGSASNAHALASDPIHPALASADTFITQDTATGLDWLGMLLMIHNLAR